MSALQGTSSLLLLVLSLLSCAEPSLVSNVFLPGSYTNWLLLLMPKLRSHRRLLRLLVWSPLPVRSLLVSAVWPLVLLSEVLRLLRETCACSNFAIGLALPLLVPVVSACSFVWRCNVGSDPTREFVNDGRGFIGGSEAVFSN